MEEIPSERWHTSTNRMVSSPAIFNSQDGEHTCAYDVSTEQASVRIFEFRQFFSFFEGGGGQGGKIFGNQNFQMGLWLISHVTCMIMLGRPMHNWTKVHLNRLYKTSKYYQKTMKMHMCYLWYMFIILTKLDVVTCHTFEMGGTKKCQIIQFSTLFELQPKIRSHHI